MEFAAKRRKISHVNKEGHFDNRKKLLVLEVEGLLADFAADPRKAGFKRPFCDEIMEFCFERFNVGVWTSRSRYKMEHALDILMRDTQHKLLFCWDRAHCTEMGFNHGNEGHIFFVKDLTKLWEKKYPNLPWEVGEYDESNTLLVEIYPHMVILNPLHTAIFPYPYRHWNTKDNSLGPKGDLHMYMERLAASEDIRKIVSEHSFGQHLVPSWKYYQKVFPTLSYERKAGDSMDAQCKNSSEPKGNSSTPLAAQTSFEPETSTTTALVDQTLSKPDLSNTVLGAQISTEPQTTTDYEQDWPFIKQSPIWATVDSLVSCLTLPQKPHFSPLKKMKELCREGLAIAHMMTYCNLVQSLPNIKLNDPIDIINDILEVLIDLETHGFDVDLIRGRLNKLVSLKSEAGQHEDTLKKLEKCNYEKLEMKKETDRLKVEMQKLQEKLAQAETVRKVKEEEIVRLQSNLHPVFTRFNDWEVAFGKLAATPL